MNKIQEIKRNLIKKLLRRTYQDAMTESKKPRSTGKSVAFFAPKNPKRGLIIKGKRVAAKAKVEKPKPRIKIVKPIATKVDKAEVIAKSDSMDLKKAREEERKENFTKIADSLVANLPKASDTGLNPNHNYKGLISILGKCAFDSALENDVLFTSKEGNNLKAKIGAITYRIEYEDRQYFEKATKKLIGWSNMGKSLNDPEGKAPDAGVILRSISFAAYEYQTRQAKLLPLDHYLESLVSKSISKELKFVTTLSNRKDVLESLVMAVAEVAVSLGFRTDKNKSAFYVNSSSNRFGASEVSKKDIRPYMQEIVEGSPYAAKLTGDNTASKLLTGVLNKLPL